MTFRNPLLLAGVAAAVLPLVLHLLQRARARPLDWGAMPLLPAGGSGRGGVGVRHATVLLLRCATIAGLAVMLARPARPAAADDAAAAAVVLVVDGSPSTLHPEDDLTRFDLARGAALERLGRLRRGDQAGLIELGASPPLEVAVSPDLQAVASRLAALRPGPGAADQADGETRARAMLEAAGVDGGEVDLIGDRQRSAWAGFTPAPRDPAGPRTFAVAVGSTRNRNVVVESLTPLDPPVVVGVPAAFVVRVRNDGDVPQGGLSLRLGGTRPDSARTDYGRTPLAVAAGGRTEAARAVTFDRAGPVTLTASIDDAGVPGDDVARCAFEVVSPPRVLVLRPPATTRPTTTATTGPATNPAPSPAGASAWGPAFGVSTASQLSPDGLRPDAVVVAGTPDGEGLRAVERYVADGGALLIAPAAGVTPAAWDRGVWKGGFGLAPAAVIGAPTPPGRAVVRVTLPRADAAAVDWTGVDVRDRLVLARRRPRRCWPTWAAGRWWSSGRSASAGSSPWARRSTAAARPARARARWTG